jgi:hypothetical protein
MTTSATGRQGDVVVALRSRGISPAAARAVWKQGGGVQEMTRALKLVFVKREFAVMIDAVTSARVGPVMRGSGDAISIWPQLAAMQPGGSYVSIHTHPGNSAFSADDAALLLVHPAILVVVVVAANGTWYVLSRLPGEQAPSEADLRSAYEEELAALVPKYEALVQSERMSRATAWIEHTNELWLRASSRLNLRYDRIR